MMTEGEIPPEVHDYLRFYETDFGRKILRREAEYIRSFLSDCDKILDVGCGPGVFEKELSDLDIVGLDADSVMIAAAQSIAGNEFRVSNAEKLPFQEGSFDGLFSVATLCFMDDPFRAVDEWARVLRPKGKFVALLCNPHSHHFQGMLTRGGYTARNLKHTDFTPIVDYLEGKFNTQGEYFLGVKDESVFDSDNPKTASIYAVKGTLK